MPKTQSIAELSRALRAQQGRVAKLATQRTKLLSSLQVVDRQISSLTGQGASALAVASPAGRKMGVGKSVDRKSLPLCLADLLTKAEDGKMRAMHMAEAVVDAGYATRDKNFKNTVAKTLAKDKRFKRVGRGVYKLAAAKK